MRLALLIAFSSGLGGVFRLLLSSLVGNGPGQGFPFGILSVNVIGCYLIGLIATLTAPRGNSPLSQEARQCLMVGFCGGFTTFSSFSLQTMDLLTAGRAGAALTYATLTLALSLAAVWAGWVTGARPSPRP